MQKDKKARNRYIYEKYFAEDDPEYDETLDYEFMINFLEFLADQPGGQITISNATARAWGLLDDEPKDMLADLQQDFELDEECPDERPN